VGKHIGLSIPDETVEYGMTFRISEWNKPPDTLVWPDDEVHVWRSTVDWSPDSLAGIKQYLSPDERARVERFFFEKDQRSHLVSRGWLRVLLGRYLCVPPDQLGFDYGAHGKPRLAAPAAQSPHQAPLQFNVSHSGEFVVIAVTTGRALGVDVERIRTDTKVVELAERYFSPHERAALAALRPVQQHDGFFNAWSRKEAFIKACGTGLAMPLDSFDVSLLPDQPAQLIATRPDADVACRWSMRVVDVADGYKAAIVVEGVGWTLKLWDWQAK
jgi:4'-phosphopantetheinyl transferase